VPRPLQAWQSHEIDSDLDGSLTLSDSLFTTTLRSHPYIDSMKGDRAMRDLIKGAALGAVTSAVVTVGVSALISLGGEPEHSMVQAIRADRTTAAANPRCAPRQLKMPCLQSDSGS
jgi:hypothetical protein